MLYFCWHFVKAKNDFSSPKRNARICSVLPREVVGYGRTCYEDHSGGKNSEIELVRGERRLAFLNSLLFMSIPLAVVLLLPNVLPSCFCSAQLYR